MATPQLAATTKTQPPEAPTAISQPSPAPVAPIPAAALVRLPYGCVLVLLLPALFRPFSGHQVPPASTSPRLVLPSIPLAPQ